MAMSIKLGDALGHWEVLKVCDIFIVETGTTPSTKKKEYWDSGSINWITPTDLSKLEGKIRISKSARKITERALKEANLTLLPKGSIIISTRAPVGYVAALEEASTFNQGCKGLTPVDENKTYSEFYCYYFLYKKRALQNISGGSTFKELSKERLENFTLPLTPLPEQKKIADVLSTADRAIEKVGEAIEKTQRLKKGLMQELLTKGIGHNELKITKMGKMPEEWKLAILSDVAGVRYGLGQPPGIDINGTPMIRATNVKDGGIYREGLICINPKDVPTGRDVVLREGEIIIVRSGAYTGDIGLVTKEWEGAIAGYDLILSPKATVNSKFLAYYLISPIIQRRYFSGLKVRSAQPHLNSSQVEKAPIAVPPLSEQQKIAEILGSVDKRIEALRNKKERLKRVKKSLMDDLLSGRKRVKLEA
jgi:type I restriction enzyme S subunit